MSSLLIPINLVVPNYGPVVFAKELKDYKVQVGAMASIVLPDLYDPNKINTPSVLSIDWGHCQDFVSGTYPNYKAAPGNNETDPGTCKVIVYLGDNNPNPIPSNFSFKVEVTPLAPAAEIKVVNIPKVSVKVNAGLPRLGAKISSITSGGLVTL